jgi:hypothetical protein
MASKKTLLPMVFFGILVSLCIAGPLCGQDISPAMEQEFLDAKAALATAQNPQVEKYSPEILKKARELLRSAESARPLKDGARFDQSSRLARAYAELAKADTEFRIEEEKLTEISYEIKKVKAETERLRKSQ